MKNKNITIAIDGFSSCGKSTLAKALAEKLDYVFIDTGAMYRAVTLFAIRNGFIDDVGIVTDDLLEALPTVEIHFELDAETKRPKVILNGRDVDLEIRSTKVASHVSKIALIKAVREKLVAQQRQLGKKGGVVMDGRDIGSVVFPNAELKLFLTAHPDIRAQRRFAELQSKGIETTLDDVKNNLEERDRIDSTRIESPLIQTDDAIVIDNSSLTPDEQLAFAYSLASKLLN